MVKGNQRVGGSIGYGAAIAVVDSRTLGAPLTTTGPQADKMIRMHQRIYGSFEKREKIRNLNKKMEGSDANVTPIKVPLFRFLT